MNCFNVIIIGAGPAGLFCAINLASEKNLNVIVIEKNLSPGKKFLLSGGGQCNITHSGLLTDFSRHYGNGGNFVKPSLKMFPPAAIIEFLHKNGITTIERDDGKIFPSSMKASDVLNMMISQCAVNNIKIVYGSPVTGTVYKDGKFNVYCDDKVFKSEFLVVASGGKSYPLTGSTGDGYRFACSMGHEITEITPALVPVYIHNYRFGELSGISLTNRKISLYRKGVKTLSASGDILFTSKGLSGPVILDIGRYIIPGDIIEVSISEFGLEEINNSFISESRGSGGMIIKNFLKRFNLPERMIALILNLEGIDSGKNVSEVNRDERTRLLRSLSGYPFMVREKGGFDIAMATAGGVSRDQIDRRSMESKIIKGLYFAGEVIDVDGDTGGYNLQWAFSSGKSAAEDIIYRFRT